MLILEELEDLKKLKFESTIVFIKLSEFVEDSLNMKKVNFLSPEGVAEYTQAFNNLKACLNKLWIVLKPVEATHAFFELLNTDKLNIEKTNYLVRAIEIVETNRGLFLCQDDRPLLIQALTEIKEKKYWEKNQ